MMVAASTELKKQAADLLNGSIEAKKTDNST